MVKPILVPNGENKQKALYEQKPSFVCTAEFSVRTCANTGRGAASFVPLILLCKQDCVVEIYTM